LQFSLKHTNESQSRCWKEAERRTSHNPVFGVSQKWLRRSLYAAQNTPLRSTSAQTAAITVAVDSSSNNVRVVDLVGRVIENHDLVASTLVLKPLQTAAVDV